MEIPPKFSNLYWMLHWHMSYFAVKWCIITWKYNDADPVLIAKFELGFPAELQFLVLHAGDAALARMQLPIFEIPDVSLCFSGTLCLIESCCQKRRSAVLHLQPILHNYLLLQLSIHHQIVQPHFRAYHHSQALRFLQAHLPCKTFLHLSRFLNLPSSEYISKPERESVKAACA